MSISKFGQVFFAFVAITLLSPGSSSIFAQPAAGPPRPNIVFIMTDDLGYGDVQAFNPQGKIATPNFDRLAREGMIFTDAHSSSAVCTPTRYSILTGRYNWRSRLQKGVLYGYSPRLIEDNLLTTPAMLKQQGYETACIGKWHVGMDWPLKGGGFASDVADAPNVDYSQAIQHGPNWAGFDYFFGIAASLDMPPYVYIENDKVTAAPIAMKSFGRRGPAAPDFEAIDVLPKLTSRTIEFLNEHGAAAGKKAPFFLYLPLASPHTPIVPTPEWQGKSGLNAYADFVMQTDHCLGLILDSIERNGIGENTLVIATSDNGFSPAAKLDELLAKGHNPNYEFRGHKADIFEGGHRIPLIARWPGRVAAGSTSDQTVCLMDLMATAAAITGATLPEDAAVDSVSFLPALEGRATGPLREALVHHSIDGSFSIRQGEWKLELCPGSGGWSDPRPNFDTTHLPAVQLYNLKNDLNEQHNVQAENPEVVSRLTALLEKYVAEGRSTPGPAQKNTVEVDIWKAGRLAHRPKPAGGEKTGAE